MHSSALDYGKLFFDTYCDRSKEITIADIGAQDVNGSLKSVCPSNAKYIGVDFLAGKGVDIILSDPYYLPFDDESLDFVVSSSCFEHSQFFWILFLEILRVLKPNGLLYLNAPSNGHIHRFPADCWRFYPDAGHALAAWGERNGYQPALIESFIGAQRDGVDGIWNDFVAVIQKDKSIKPYPIHLMLDSIEKFQNGWRYDKDQVLNDTFLNEDFLKHQQNVHSIEKINTLNAELNEVIFGLKTESANQSKQTENLISQSKQKELEINNLNTEIKNHNDKISEKESEIEMQKQENEKLQRAIKELSGEIEARKKNLINSEIENQALKLRLYETLSSSSWKITLPLRSVKNFFSSQEKQSGRTRKIKFDSVWYLAQNPDVAASNIPPLEHYEKFGAAEGRRPHPDPFLVRNWKRLQVIRQTLPMIRARADGSIEFLTKTLNVVGREGLEGIKQRVLAANEDIQSGKRDRNDYPKWIHQFDTLTSATIKQQQREARSFNYSPTISVLMPTYNSNHDWLREAIESVRRQTYQNWELCIADDASADKAVLSLLKHYSDIDSRIKVVFRKTNGHISASSNSALEMATGEWTALLDHDDLLAESALYWVVKALNINPGIHLIYSDEDKISEAGKRFDPYFKSDWNIDLFYSQNMICHLGVYRTQLMRDVGGFREGFEGSQDYDIALRYIEMIRPNQIHHIPRILYHWRVHSQSTAKTTDAKPYALVAGEKALNEHFQRIGVNAKISWAEYGYRAQYALPAELPFVSLIIPTRNGLDLIRQCVSSILEKTNYSEFEIIIVDNGSDDPDTLLYFQSLGDNPKIKVIRDERPFNYSMLNNSAALQANGEIIGLINNDIEVITPDWLSEMVSIAIQPEVGAVGARLWYPNDTLQHGGVILGVGGIAGHAHKYSKKAATGYFSRAQVLQSFSAVTAACLLVKKEIYQSVGGLDEKNLTIAFNDVDFCLRIQEAGYRNIWTPYAELYHHESATRGSEDNPEKKARFAKECSFMENRWSSILKYDPAYSPNLTLEHEDFSLAWPPRI